MKTGSESWCMESDIHSSQTICIIDLSIDLSQSFSTAIMFFCCSSGFTLLMISIFFLFLLRIPVITLQPHKDAYPVRYKNIESHFIIPDFTPCWDSKLCSVYVATSSLSCWALQCLITMTKILMLKYMQPGWLVLQEFEVEFHTRSLHEWLFQPCICLLLY